MVVVTDAEAAAQLSDQACTIIVVDCPSGIHVGLDYLMWKTGSKFKGVQLIPPGPHFLFCSVEDTASTGVGLRTGKFLYLRPGEVVVRKWNDESESLDEVDETTHSAFAEGLRRGDFVTHLGSYAHEYREKWVQLTSHVTQLTLKRLEPIGGTVSSFSREYDDTPPKREEEQQATSEAAQDQGADSQGARQTKTRRTASGALQAPATSSTKNNHQDIESFNSECVGRPTGDGENVFFFTTVPPAVIPHGASPSQITALSLDKSDVLEQIIVTTFKGNERELLGELQYAYIVLLLGQNYDGFEQWKSLLQLLCTCPGTASKKPTFFAEFIRVLYTHLDQAPHDLLSSDLTKSNFLTTCLLSLCEICDDAKLPEVLKKRLKQLKVSANPSAAASTNHCRLTKLRIDQLELCHNYVAS
eukprot:Selendium_serpulae@DN5771_c0_g1_i1.p1